jgi:hypothetical protein
VRARKSGRRCETFHCPASSGNNPCVRYNLEVREHLSDLTSRSMRVVQKVRHACLSKDEYAKKMEDLSPPPVGKDMLTATKTRALTPVSQEKNGISPHCRQKDYGPAGLPRCNNSQASPTTLSAQEDEGRLDKLRRTHTLHHWPPHPNIPTRGTCGPLMEMKLCTRRSACRNAYA